MRRDRPRVKKNKPLRRCDDHPGGSFDLFDAKAVCAAKLPAEANLNPSHGEGVLMRYSSRPTNQCKGRSDSITEYSSGAPPTRHFGPLAPEDRARCLAELRAVLAGTARAFQVRIDAGELGERP